MPPTEGRSQKGFRPGTLGSGVETHLESRPWRVAVTRAETEAGPLTRALGAEGLLPVSCPVLIAAPPLDPAPLLRAAEQLEAYDWVICASARAVEALRPSAVRRGWPAGVRTAAVGPATAKALIALGVADRPVTAGSPGADALWATLAACDVWAGRRVLVLTTPGGRTTLMDELSHAGARVDAIEAYRMVPRPAAEIRFDWDRAAPDAVVLASPRTATALLDAVGREALASCQFVVAIGETTAQALETMGVSCQVPSRATFEEAARTVARLLPSGDRA